MSQIQTQPMEVVYPNSITTGQTHPPSHSNGSFGPVFAVLAVIVVISAVACVLGRLCSRKHAKEAGHKSQKKSNKHQVENGLGPKQWEARQKPSFNMSDHGDIEFGFGKSSSKGGKNGGNVKPQRGYKQEVRFADNV